ncbi:WD repeat-containing protein 53 [Dissophora globulifera]|uniref:WD repeat-containing protein 53 n=1 Tax=Dissophora globulifera TaxID=979702 RepID=A0A9P6V035_9FUNG|nr:WD repeat-containing protein 53 [Dissophora globulifera]
MALLNTNNQPASFLVGHVAPVLTLESRDWMLASGSEDKTCRIWDIRTDKVHKALRGFESSVTTTSFAADDHTIYVGSGDKVYSYDLRMESLLLNATQASKIYDGAEDEINQEDLKKDHQLRHCLIQIQVNHKATYLVACDDAGDVRVLDLKSHKWTKRLERRHDNIAMTVQFVPKKELQALSGGMDKLVVAWDFYKGRVMQLIDTDNPQQEGTVQSKQLFNPPFVHSITAHPSGTRVAIGLGDGSIQFLHTAADPPTASTIFQQDGGSSGSSKKNKKKGSTGASGKGTEGWLLGGRLVEAHASPIATIEYAGFNANWLVTSASNGSIAVWEDQASRYESFQRQQQVLEVLKQSQEQQLERLRQNQTLSQEPPVLPFGRPLEPLYEFKTIGVFERVNCVSTSKSSQGEKRLFVAGTHARAEEKKLQGRIAVYNL